MIEILTVSGLIKEQQQQNLLILAEYLENLPENYEHFDMEYFVEYHKGGGSTEFEVQKPLDALELAKDGYAVPHTCGSVACAAGHAVFIESLPDPEINEGWQEFVERVFGVGSATELDVFESMWEFLFGTQWSDYYNTPKDAAKRIRYLLNHGLPYEPEEYPDHDKNPNFARYCEIQEALDFLTGGNIETLPNWS